LVICFQERTSASRIPQQIARLPHLSAAVIASCSSQ